MRSKSKMKKLMKPIPALRRQAAALLALVWLAVAPPAGIPGAQAAPAERPVRSERPERAERAERTLRAERPDRPDKPEKERPERPDRPERRNPARAGAAAGDTLRAGACLALHETAYDFGDVPRKGGDLVHAFRFRNEGTAPLVITRVQISCSCHKATHPRRPVMPGEEGSIDVIYEPHKSEPGNFNKVIQIFSNDPAGRRLITVQGNSID